VKNAKRVLKRKQCPVRCSWVPQGNALYEAYHDTEWGVPVHDDRRHFEFLLLEGAQAGLSWETILKRRKEYDKAFAHFDWEKVARFTQKDIEKLLKNPGIIRNRSKIESAVLNAQLFNKIREEFGNFDVYVWRFVQEKPLQPRRKSVKEIPAVSKEAEVLSKDLKKRGFKFVGPTIIYAYMQAVGLINDHTTDCFRFTEVKIMKVEMKAIISGNVQGVGFRATVKYHADRLKLEGYTKNLPDGSVEICAQGDKQSLEALLEALKEEFKGNYIQNIEASYSSPVSGFSGFTIRR